MSSDWAALTRVCKGYNMIDSKMVVDGCKANPGKECSDLKRICHNALKQGQSHVNNGQLKEANSNFALAYQARCVCDYVWVNVMGKHGDASHAEFLSSSRDFGAFCTDGLTGKAKQEALNMIKHLK